MIILLRLILGHLIGDFVLQTGRIAKNKQTGWPGLLVHTALVTFATGIVSVNAFPNWWQWILIIGLIHLLIDSVRTFVFRQLPPQMGILYLIGDQIAHVGCLVAVTVVGGNVPLETLTGGLGLNWHHEAAWLIGLSFVILLVWVEPVVEMEMLRALSNGKGSAIFMGIHPVDRVIGAIERLILLSILLGPVPWLAPVALVPRVQIYQRLGQLRNQPTLNLALTRALTSAVFVSAIALSIKIISS